MTRTTIKHSRVYVDGYDLSGYSRQFGPLVWSYDVEPAAALTDSVMGGLPGPLSLSFGVLNGFMDNAAGGLHTALNASGVSRYLMAAIGMGAAPVAGDPVFVGAWQQAGYSMEGDNAVYVNIPFAEVADVTHVGNIRYQKPWGVLLHPKAAETAANTATGLDDNGAASALGGYMAYQIFAVSGTGDVTIKVQHASTNSNASFSDLSGVTSGAIAHTAIPTAGMIATSAATTSVNRYLRWQIALNGITSVTFALAFIRSNQ